MSENKIKRYPDYSEMAHRIKTEEARGREEARQLRKAPELGAPYSPPEEKLP